MDLSRSVWVVEVEAGDDTAHPRVVLVAPSKVGIARELGNLDLPVPGECCCQVGDKLQVKTVPCGDVQEYMMPSVNPTQHGGRGVA